MGHTVLKEEKVGRYRIQLNKHFSEYKKKDQYTVYVPKAGQEHRRLPGIKYYNTFDELELAEQNFEYVKKTLNGREEEKAKARQERNAAKKIETDLGSSEIQVGDFFHRSWGYNMTINDFYQVVDKKGKKVFLAKLGVKDRTGGGYSGSETPALLEDPSKFDLSKAITASIIGRQTVSVEGDKVSKSNPEKDYYYNTMD